MDQAIEAARDKRVPEPINTSKMADAIADEAINAMWEAASSAFGDDGEVSAWLGECDDGLRAKIKEAAEIQLDWGT
jgi:hypothetical protein